MNERVNVVSFSGGRTSAYLVHLMEQKRRAEPGFKVSYIFCDTGAEHPKTYEFIKNIVKHYKIDLVCLRPVVSKKYGVGVTYKIIPLGDIKHDLQPWKDLIKVYGTPYNPGGGFCTDKMKTILSNKYCKDRFGKNGYHAWIGYRYDEPKRVWGHKLYPELIAVVGDPFVASDIAIQCMAISDVETYLKTVIPENIDMFSEVGEEDGVISRLGKRIAHLKKSGFRFLMEISNKEKEEILRFWKKKEYDLAINEWSGNCVFCVKKGENKLALAIKDNPDLYKEFSEMLIETEIKDTQRQFGPLIMYRHHNSIMSIAEKYKDVTRNDLLKTIKGNKALDSGGCSESCEPYSDQIDAFEC